MDNPVLMPEQYLGIWLFDGRFVFPNDIAAGKALPPCSRESPTDNVKFISFVADGKCWKGPDPFSAGVDEMWVKTTCDDNTAQVQVFR